MKTNTNKIKSLIGFVLLCGGALAQDIHFSQYAEIQSSINPALAGTIYNTRAMATFKSQWGSVAKSYQTIGFSFEQSIGKKLRKYSFTSIFNIFRDQAGDAKMRMLNPNLGMCVGIKLDKTSKLSAGFQTGFIYRTIDINALRWENQWDESQLAYNPELSSGEAVNPRSAITGYDGVIGLNYSYAASEKFISARDGNKFNAGFCMQHFGLPRNSFIINSEKLSTRLNFHMNADINIPNSKNAIMGNVLYMRQATNSEITAGALFKFILQDQSTYTGLKKPMALAAGFQYRYKDAVIPCALFLYDKYAFGLSYDVNVSALTPASRRMGGIEVMLRYNVSPGYGKNLGRTDTKASY